MADFHEVNFPLRIALGTSGGPKRRVDIVNLANGSESRNARWQNARRHYDAGSGLRSVTDIYKLLEFFEAREGALHGFRFRDPIDYKSCAPDANISHLDQKIGVGDGVNAYFPLIKYYSDAAGSTMRKIEKPESSTVLIAVDDVLQPPSNYSLNPNDSKVVFEAGFIPAVDAKITAGFLFDVPVRFDLEQLEINLTSFCAGTIPSVPLMEIRP